MDGVPALPEKVQEILREEDRRGGINFHLANDALKVLYPRLRKRWEEQLLGDEAVEAAWGELPVSALPTIPVPSPCEVIDAGMKEERDIAGGILRAAIDATKGGEG